MAETSQNAKVPFGHFSFHLLSLPFIPLCFAIIQFALNGIIILCGGKVTKEQVVIFAERFSEKQPRMFEWRWCWFSHCAATPKIYHVETKECFAC